MGKFATLDPNACNNDLDNEFLIQYDECIRTIARKAIPRGIFSEDVLDLEIDNLAQCIRIKLWESRQKRFIVNPKAYIRTIARTKVIDLVRCHRETISLFTEENGGPNLSDLLAAQNEGFRDPAYEIEREEISIGSLAKLVDAILALPSRQRHAILYSLKMSSDEVPLVINALKARGVDVVAIDPLDKKSEGLLKASLFVTRKKLQWLREEFISL